ncbi:DUF6455 family protein [Roseibium sp.]|uniref:DUF6455 family protein n=1 Tax=Roseibium sp. TaxID=1936156 RepID=UPI003267E296
MERLNERAELMGRMLKTIDAMKDSPPGTHSGSVPNSAAFQCMHCTATESCRKWLRDHPQGAGQVLPECANAALFNSWLQN